MSSTELAINKPLVKASSELSQYLGMEVPMMIDALKSQAFKGKRPDEITDAQLATYISTANALKLNPLLPGQMYAYPDRQGGGVTVMLGPDGVFTLLSNHPDVVAQKDGGPAFWTEHGKDGDADTCTGYINHRTKGLLKKTIWVAEWIVSSNPNWQSRKHHMAEVRALKQVARMVIHGLPVDSDEHKLGEMLNVTDSVPTDEAKPVDRPAPPKRAPKGASAVADTKTAQPSAIEVETLPPKTETVADAPAGTKTIVERAAEIDAAKTAPAKTEPAPSAEPRTALADKEEITVAAKIEKVYALMITLAGKPTPSVQANVSGQFTGTVYHFDAAEATEKDGIVPKVPWKEGAAVKLTIFGRLNAKSGKVMTVVKAVEEGQTDTSVEVD